MIDFAAISGAPFIEAFLLAALAAYSQYVVLRAGIFSVATVGFVSIGAFTTSSLTVKRGWSTPLAVLCSVVIAAAVAVVLGAMVRKLRGAYQAIATLAFVIILEQLFLEWSSLTGGYAGTAGIPFWATESVLIVTTVAVVAVIFALELRPIGRKQRAVFFNELAAASCGASVVNVNLALVTLSGAIGGLAGAATAGNLSAVDPTAFDFGMIITTLSAVIIGGYRSFLGPLIGSFIVVALPLLFDNYQVLSNTIDAIVTILILVLAPRGVASLLPIDSERIARLAGRLRARREQGRPPSGDEEPNPLTAGGGSGQSPGASLVVTDIARSYGRVRAVAGVSLEVWPGQVVGLIGPNGAGKTSVINLLAGVTRLDSGSVRLADESIEQLDAYRIARLGVTRTFQTCRLFPESTAYENVLFGAMSGRNHARRSTLPDRACARAAMELADCLDLADRMAGSLPYSHQRHVEIARALASEPRFVLLDEPAAGMTQSESERLAAVVRRIAELGIGVLVIDHNVPWICSVSDYLNVQHLGKIIAAGRPADVREDPAVLAAYIGSRDEHVPAELERAIDAQLTEVRTVS